MIVYRERSTSQHYRSDHTTKIMARKYIHSEYEIAGKNFLLKSNRMQKKAHTPDLNIVGVLVCRGKYTVRIRVVCKI